MAALSSSFVSVAGEKHLGDFASFERAPYLYILWQMVFSHNQTGWPIARPVYSQACYVDNESYNWVSTNIEGGH